MLWKPKWQSGKRFEFGFRFCNYLCDPGYYLTSLDFSYLKGSDNVCLLTSLGLCESQWTSYRETSLTNETHHSNAKRSNRKEKLGNPKKAGEINSSSCRDGDTWKDRIPNLTQSNLVWARWWHQPLILWPAVSLPQIQVFWGIPLPLKTEPASWGVSQK